MKYLFSDTVLERYCWGGTPDGKKKPFKQLIAINNLIYESVKRQFRAFKKIEYKNYLIYKWLKHSRSRQRIVTYRYPTRNDPNDELSGFEEEEEEDDDI